MININRSKYKIPKEKVDVVVVDIVGSEWVSYCIPDSCKYVVVPVRDVIPYVGNVSFFISLIKNIFLLGMRPKICLLASVIEQINPSVVITVIENNDVLGSLYKIFPHIKMISVQNGLRVDTDVSIGKIKKNYMFDDYYTFGLFEKEVFTSKNVKILNHYPKGSLKLGIYLARAKKENDPIKKVNKVVCFVSQYRQGMFDSDSPPDKIFMNGSKILFELTVLWALENNFSVLVSMSCERNEIYYDNELNFFKNINNSEIINFVSNDRVQMLAYDNAMSSKLVIGMDSALLLEMLGVGKKILWGTSSVNTYLISSGMVKFKEKMPSEIMLFNLNKKTFGLKVNALLAMSQKDYIAKTKPVKEYFMNIGDVLPHEAIKISIRNKVFRQRKG